MATAALKKATLKPLASTLTVTADEARDTVRKLLTPRLKVVPPVRKPRTPKFEKFSKDSRTFLDKDKGSVATLATNVMTSREYTDGSLTLSTGRDRFTLYVDVANDAGMRKAMQSIDLLAKNISRFRTELVAANNVRLKNAGLIAAQAKPKSTKVA